MASVCVCVCVMGSPSHDNRGVLFICTVQGGRSTAGGAPRQGHRCRRHHYLRCLAGREGRGDLLPHSTVVARIEILRNFRSFGQKERFGVKGPPQQQQQEDQRNRVNSPVLLDKNQLMFYEICYKHIEIEFAALSMQQQQTLGIGRV